MQTITEEYRRLNKELHDENSHYGTSGKKHASQIMALCGQMGTRDVLDYGCGKSTLAKNLPFKIKQYDPAISKYSAKPEPADIVVCTDVLEHIEPDLIENVLDEIQRVTKKAGWFTAATRPAKKTLSDGRNAHLIIEDYKWWLGKILERFDIVHMTNVRGEVAFMVSSKRHD